MQYFKILIWITILSAWSKVDVNAQFGPVDEMKGVHYTILPIFGFNSDVGFYGGGTLERKDYGIGIRPFSNRTRLELNLSTEGNLITDFDHERLKAFGQISGAGFD